MRQDRTPKPRPPGFRNNFSIGRDNSGRPPQFSPNNRPQFSQNRGQGRPPQSRPPQPSRPRPASGPAPVAKTPDRWKERRAMLKAAAWRLGKMVHKSPAAIIAAEDPSLLIRVPDTKARQLVKKILRLKKTRKPAPVIVPAAVPVAAPVAVAVVAPKAVAAKTAAPKAAAPKAAASKTAAPKAASKTAAPKKEKKEK